MLESSLIFIQHVKLDKLRPPLMDPESVIALFDSCWFNLEIFNKNSSKSISEKYPHNEFQENSSAEPKISKQPSILMRSKSDQHSFSSDSFSPNSVLFTNQLHKILPGKEFAGEDLTQLQQIEEKLQRPEKNNGRRRRRRRQKSSLSKSLSDLEFEELKGFMDLGFVFSEEDRDSSLVEIIPGLQRLGKKKNEDVEEEDGEENIGKSSAVSRPYLSEAWEVLERRKRENPLMNWRIPAPNNEIDMKDSLKWWAHTVASAVR